MKVNFQLIHNPSWLFTLTLRQLLKKKSWRKRAEEKAIQGTEDVSIAVLAFVNMYSDPEQVYITDGIYEELLSVLAKIDGWTWLPAPHHFTLKGRVCPLVMSQRHWVCNIFSKEVFKKQVRKYVYQLSWIVLKIAFIYGQISWPRAWKHLRYSGWNIDNNRPSTAQLNDERNTCYAADR